MGKRVHTNELIINKMLIDQRLKENNITRSELADVLNCSEPTITRILNGEIMFKLQDALKISKLTKLPISSFARLRNK